MATANPFRFSTKYQDDETGLLYFGHRYYDPSTGRLNSREGIGEAQSVNSYSQAHNQPVNKTSGLGIDSTKPRTKPKPVEWEHGGGRVQIPRCTYLIIAAHGRAAPSELYVDEKDKGCAFGAVYGCLTGGGEYVNPAEDSNQTMPPVVIMPPVPSPGIPDGPAQPGGPIDGEDDCIGGDDLSKLVHDAKEAAMAAVKSGALCGLPCCCTTVTVWVHIIGGRQGFPDDVREELYMRGCKQQ
jgi:RHS repeat-associated protein